MNAIQLKASILNLAIRGLLLPQNPNDQPASQLLLSINPKAQPVNPQDEPFPIPNSWTWCRLGDLFDHNTGKALNSSNKEGTLKDYLTTSNVYWDRFDLSVVKKMLFKDNELDKCTVTKGDLLVCEGGDVGRAAIWNYDYDICIQNHLHRLRPKGDLCVLFFFYMLRCLKEKKVIGGKGIGLLGFSSNALHTLLIPLPPLPEQQRIASKIQQLEPLIEQFGQSEEALRSLNASIKDKLKNSILQEAIRGLLLPQNPNDQPASQLLLSINPNAQPVNPQDEPFPIPNSWTWTALKNVGEVVTGSTPSKQVSEYYGGDIPFFKPTDLEQGVNTSTSNDHLTKLGYEHSRKLPANSVLVTCIGATIGKTGIITTEGACNQQINAIIPSGAILPTYLYYVCVSSYVQNEIKSSASSTTLPILNKNNFADLLIPLPPLPEQQRIASKIQQLFSTLNDIQSQL